MVSKKKKDTVSKGNAASNGCVNLFIGLIVCGLIIYVLYIFIVDNIPKNTLLTLKIIGISLLALIATYVTFKIIKFIYCAGYNVFLFMDTKFSIAEKYHKITSSPKSKRIQMQEHIKSLEKEIEELNHKLAESQNTTNELSQGLKNENEVSESKSDQSSTFLKSIKSFWGTAVPDSRFNAGSDEDYIIKAAEVAVEEGQISTTLLQRKLKLGYARASRIMDALEERCIIGPAEGAMPRKVLINRVQYETLVQELLEHEKSLSDLTHSENKTLSQNKPNLTYDEIKSLPEYKIIRDYTSNLKIIDLRKFINELSPFDYDKTTIVLAALIADGTLTEYTEGHYIYAEYNSILSFIDGMSENGIEFERFTSELLVKNGFTNVKLTQGSGDYGIDVLAEKDSITYAIQCKCYSKPVGNKAVQEAYSGKDFYRCMVAVVFTNNYFTKSAIETAKQNNVILWDRNKLIELIKPLQTNNHTNDELHEVYKGQFSNLLKEMADDVVIIYSLHNILLTVGEIYPDDNGVLWELEAQNIDDIANIHLYIDELQEKLNTKVTLKEPLQYPKVCIYVNYSEDLRNSYNNFKSI